MMKKIKITTIFSIATLTIVFPRFALAQNSFEPPSSKANKIAEPAQSISGDFFQTSLYMGSATYAYPIEVPSGTNQLTPELFLSYDSSAASNRSDWCGLGWDLNLSYIQRDVNYTPDSLADDKFDLILNGVKHDLVYIAGEDRYHTKIESHLWIKKVTGNSNSQGEYWILKDKNGKEYRFGYNLDSEHMASTRNYVWRWSLDRVKDTNNNQISFTYQENPAPNDIGAVYLSNIKYNNEEKRVVNFILEAADKPDAYIFFEQGSKIRKTRRLKEIDILVDNIRVRKYQLNYTTSPSSSRSLLASIIQFGSDGISSLPPTIFTYQQRDRGFEPAISWTAPGWISEGQESTVANDTFDINRDGRPDYIRSFNNGSWGVRTNNGTGFSSEIPWPAPGHWIHHAESLNFYDTFDFNGDGLPDLVDASGSTQWNIYFNNGNGFNPSVSWNAPRGWLSWNTEDSDQFTMYDTFDINGDGLSDFVESFLNDSNWHVYLNTGNGFAPARLWPAFDHQIRYSFFEGEPPERNTTYDVLDINNDGLPDLVDANLTNIWRVYLSNGNGFSSPINWPAPFHFLGTAESPADYVVRSSLFDINGDGLPDFVKKFDPDILPSWKVHLNSGFGFGPELDWPTTTSSYGIQTGEFFSAWDKPIDLNGDGLIDFVKSANWSIYRNKMTAIDLLTQIQTPQGGRIAITYVPSTQFDNSGADTIPDLGFVVWCVRSMTRDNGMSGAHQTLSTYQYEYADGFYDYADKEFRGFGYVKLIEPTGDYSEYYFHQDDAKKGKSCRVQAKDGSGNIYSKTEQSWNSQTLFTLPEEVYFTYLGREDNYTYDGNSQNPKESSVLYPGYDSYGNVTEIHYLGDSNVVGDEKYNTNEYVYNVNLWIVDKLKHTFSDDENHQRNKESWYAYDNGPIGAAPIRGNATRFEEWLDTGANPFTLFAYDGYGNKISMTDARNYTTSMVYDSVYHTFAVEVHNAKGQITLNSYDPSSGQLLSTQDPNGFIVSYVYDGFQRLLKEIQPLDNAQYPTRNYQYFNDGIAPEGILISEREISSQPGTLDNYIYKDGFDRTIQLRAEAEDTAKEIVKDTFYNAIGKIDRTSIPYPVNRTNNYSQPNLSIRNISFQYDVMKRVVRTTNTDGTFRTSAYDHWVVTQTNERNMPTDFTYDAYQRLIGVQEHSGSQVYSTAFEYDARDNLEKITDNQSNITTIQYDSLNRKIIRNDPDLGHWSYTYDAVSNLASQTDANNVIIQFSYDLLNRLIKRDYPTGPDADYIYDVGTIGALSETSDSSGITRYYYDSRKRKIREEKNIAGTMYRIQWSYDAMDRVASITYPDQAIVHYTYNSQGEVESIPGYIANIDYNARGNIIRKAYANNVLTNFTYNDADLRLNRIETPGFQDLVFDYDDGGNVTSIADNLRNTTQVFQYDSLNRLLSATGPYGVKAYTYDSIGNIITKENIVYTYNPMIPHAIASGSNGSSYNYDTSGNMIAKTENGINTAYQFDFENRLIGVAMNGTSMASFVYAENGARIIKKVNAKILARNPPDSTVKGTAETVYIESLFEKTGKVATKHIFLKDDRVVSQDSDGSYWYHTDHLESSNVVTNQLGQQIQREEYAPYGETLFVGGKNIVDYKFNGKELDETGLYFYGARYYEPHIARFITADSVDPDIDKPQSLNRYAYALNNPLTYIDPNGNWPIPNKNTDDSSGQKGWASSLSDTLDDSIETAFTAYQEYFEEGGNDQDWIAVGLIATGADLLKGSADLLRLGESTAQGLQYFEAGNHLMGVSEVLFDVSRAASLGAAVAGAGESTFGTLRHATDAAGAEGIAKTGEIMAQSGKNFFSSKKYGSAVETNAKNAMDKTLTHFVDVPRHRIGGYVRGPGEVNAGNPPRTTGGVEYYNTKPVKVYKQEIKPFLK